MRRPNVLIILTDDQGWGDLSVHGNTNLKTPNVDSLARDGAIFDRFYVCPVCAPTRAEFLTGRYHLRTGVHGVSTGAERLNLDEVTIADTFKSAGYATAAFGKWHNGTQHPYHPNARGFDEFFGFCSGHWGEYFDAEVEHNGQFTTGQGYLPDEITNRAIDFLTTCSHTTQPFFCYLAFNIPHTPFQVPDQFYEKFRNRTIDMMATDPTQENVDRTRAALALCENIDWNVGRLLEQLDRLGITDDTIIFYFGDNGPNGARWNGEMKGVKGSTDEGGVRVPGLMRWPGEIPAGTQIQQISGGIDLLPTLTDLTNINLIGHKPLDGRSLKPLLYGQDIDWPERLIFTHHREQISVRNQRFRLAQNGQLYDMTDDPSQMNDISNVFPEVKSELNQAVADWRAELLPIKDSRPFTVGYWQSTSLPARDGISHGNIQRSANAPNCSYFSNWVSIDDAMTWDIQVGTSGSYEAILYYTCSEVDVGSTIEITFEKQSLKSQVVIAHDPPLIGKKNDRYPRRGESYVKDFKPLSLGTIELPAGHGRLALRALEVAGFEVMDLRRIVLNRLER